MAATVAEIRLPAEEFALSYTASQHPECAFEIERVAAHSTDYLIPYVWAKAEPESLTEETISNSLADDPSVDEINLLTDLDEEYLYQMQWVDKIDTLVQVLTNESGTILAAHGDAESWNFRLVFPKRKALSRTYDYCADNNLTFDVRTIYTLDDGRQGRFGLTDEQQDTITTAYHEGYYNIPRDATAEELANNMDVSHQAVSERLRRGHKSIVKNTLIFGEGPNDS